ncbi:MAG: T9SS type A sorting domain-containing protein [Chitinophagales bacterium]
MKHLFTITTTIILGLLLSSGLMAQSVEFDYTDGSKSSYDLEDVAQITFTGNILNLKLKDGTVYSNDISTIQKFQYDETTVGIEQALENMNALEIQAYPNPNNGNFQIAYTLPKTAKIQVSIVNIEGKTIKDVFEGTQQAGKQTHQVQLPEAASGTYIYRISSERMTVSKQMIIKK